MTATPTFDKLSRIVEECLLTQRAFVQKLPWLVVNRDLYGKIRLVAPDSLKPPIAEQLKELGKLISDSIGAHGYPEDRSVIFDSELKDAVKGASAHLINGWEMVYFADRLATEGDWASIQPINLSSKRIVFYSIKGGVGRSTALAATAWSLAQSGKKVLVLDLDLESPGLSSSLLPSDKQPAYGITDWLVEDLVGNGDAVLADMIASSDLSREGEIHVVPSHGATPGEYITKLSRVWMPKINSAMNRECWSTRLCRLIDQLEDKVKPDVVLIDSRAGIDEVAGACVTDLGARLILLFALEGTQTWNGYSILLKHWRDTGNAAKIRDRLQVVGAMIPEVDSVGYIDRMREDAYSAFLESVYDSIPSGEIGEGAFNFEATDDTAPHAPWCIRWNRGMSGVRSLHQRLMAIDPSEVSGVFGHLTSGITTLLGEE